MNRRLAATTAAFGLFFVTNALATDACSSDSILTRADVSVSDGTSFQTESWYHLPDAAAIKHIEDDVRLVAVDGPFGWATADERYDVGKDFYRQFALGHQFHAILLRFDQIVGNVAVTEESFDGHAHTVETGDSPFGGTIGLVRSGDESAPAGLLFRQPDAPAIEARFSEWRPFGDRNLPSVIVIDDTEREFTYTFTDVSITTENPLWYFDAIQPPASDQIEIYRLHRRLLAAHCMGDARMMADLSTPETVIANRGEIRLVSRDETATRFAAAFERFDYTGYTDLVPPVVTVSESGDIGWIAVNVVAKGIDRTAGMPFEDRWAWIMTTRKVDGAWLHSGNASNLRQ